MSGTTPDQNSNADLLSSFQEAFAKRDFQSAHNIAIQAGSQIGIAKAEAFLSRKFNASSFLAIAEAAGGLGEALLECATEALLRKKKYRAAIWAGRIPKDHKLFADACLLRLSILRTAFHKRVHPFFISELTALMRIIARTRGDTSLRLELEKLLEKVIEEPLVKALLSKLLIECIRNLSLLDKESIKKASLLESSKNYTLGAQTVEDIQRFYDLYIQSIPASKSKIIIIGKGELPEAARALVGPQLVHDMAKGLLLPEIGSNFEQISILLTPFCLACNAAGDPSTDFAVLQSLIDYHGSHQMAQESRNLGEHALQFWPESQPEYLNWRISQGWECLAEACLRTKNTLAALRYLCLGRLACEEAAIELELLRRIYRRAARVFRDLHLYTLSLECLAYEDSLVRSTGASKEALHRIEVFRLQLALPGCMDGTLDDRLKVLQYSEELLEKGVESELHPLISAQASLLRLLPRSEVPPKIRESFLGRVEKMPAPLKYILGVAVAEAPTRAQIISLIESLPDAQDYQYLAFQIANSLPAFSNAIRYAVESNDKELFLLASGPFCQPCVGLQAMGNVEELSDKKGTESPSYLHSVSLENLIAQKFEDVERFSFKGLTQLSIDRLSNVLASDEAIVILAGEPHDPPFVMVLDKLAISAPAEMKTWANSAFRDWLKTYRSKLDWKKPPGYIPGFDALQPPAAVIKKMFRQLSLDFAEVPSSLTIIPAARLFGFTWNLSLHKQKFLIESSRLAIAPSATWLIASRSNTWKGKSQRRAWLGSSASSDGTIKELRRVISPCLAQNGFLTSDEPYPTNFVGSELVVIGAHGGTGVGDFFRTVSDGVNHFSGIEIAQALRGCGCVVLAVCSGGRSDNQFGSEETLGFLSELFRVGIRCVIGSPWPLSINVVRHWLPTFLENMRLGRSAGVAAERARDSVRKEIDHPCAWGQFHVYGDQSFTLPQQPPA